MCIKIQDKPVLYTENLKKSKSVLYYFICPECAWCLTRGLKTLSLKTRKQRFNTPLKNFSAIQIEYLTNIDNYNHIRIIAEKKIVKWTIGLGVGRCKRLPEKPDTAELAITIVDKYQNRGLGTKLIALLSILSLERDITKFCAHVNKENTAMINLLENFYGKVTSQDYNDAVYEIDLNKAKEIADKVLNKKNYNQPI